MGATVLTLLVRGSLVAAVLLVACVDGPAGPGRFGQLRIRPTYIAADAPAAIGADLDSAAVRVTRPNEPSAPLVDTTVVYESDTASLGWIVDLREEEESLYVEVTIWDGATELYSGAGDVVVHDGTLTSPTTDAVAVGYVGPPIVASVIVNPGTSTLEAFGATAALDAEARDRHDNVVSGATFTWSSSNAAVATVDANGIITAVGNGSTSVTAQSGTHTGSATIVVDQRVASITVSPPSMTLTALGTTHAFSAAASDANDHAVADAAITWSSDATSVASVDASGVVTANGGGSAVITAESDGVTATAHVTVSPIADVASIVVSPSVSTLHVAGATQAFAAQALDANGDPVPVAGFTWSSAATDVATIDAATGVATATGHGQTTITATAAGVSGQALLVVDLGATVETIVVTPSSALVSAIGATQQFSAEARDALGAPVPGIAFTWSSEDTAVATVDPVTGLAHAVAHGSTAIRATAGGVTGTATLTVDLTPLVASVTVSPAAVTLQTTGAQQQFLAEARDADGALLPGVVFTWTSSAPSVATVDATGLAAAVNHGTTTITASANGQTGTASLTVDLTSTIVAVIVTPSSATLGTPGMTQQFTAEARDANGNVVPVDGFVWSSEWPHVATVDTTGLATAVAHGSTAIRATVAGVTGEAALLVDLKASVATVEVVPDSATLMAGDSLAFTAIARDANGVVLPGVLFAWTSGNEDVATVQIVTGVALAIAEGTTSITASVRGISGSATVAVTSGALIRTDGKIPRLRR